jgi:EAL domain-containing protein (putative c-di-GMP-specific phosphodiesterase class I)
LSDSTLGVTTTSIEQARLRELEALKLLGTQAEQRFDRLTRLIADVLEVPICLVSLLDAEQVWVKSAFGMPAGTSHRRDTFLCHVTLYQGQGQLLMVEDATQEVELADNPLVSGAEGIRFYAGLALFGPGGLPVGTLCVMDTVPRTLCEAGIRRLRAFGQQVEHEITITERLRGACDDLLDQAFYDPDSSLPKKLLGQEQLQRLVDAAQAEGRKGALAAVHFLHFDEFHTTYGREALSEAIWLFAERLRRLAGPGGLVSRPERDRMMVARADFLTMEEAGQWAQRVHEDVTVPYSVGEGHRSALVAIGVCEFAGDVASAHELIRRANLAKEGSLGPGLRRYDTSLEQQVRRRDQVSRALLKALENNDLMLHYQPILSGRSGRVVACEALARWHSEEFGFVSPGEFIPLTEESPQLCRTFTRWVLSQACRAALEWNLGMPSPVAVTINIAGSEFYRQGFVADVEEALVATGLARDLLIIEVTEQTLIQQIDDAVGTLHQLRWRGIRCALDDFGTGYSSLSYLRQMPLDILKIDRSFLDNLAVDQTAQEVTRGIANIGKVLKMDVVAEGIETLEQQSVLCGLGIEHMQGFLWHRPMPLDVLQQALKAAMSDKGQGAIRCPDSSVTDGSP